MVAAGHPNSDIHSGEGAVIAPRKVMGLGRREVALVAVAKHHTVVATVTGEMWSWGSNRDGRLGYPAVDTQPTPRRYTNQLQACSCVFCPASTCLYVSGPHSSDARLFHAGNMRVCTERAELTAGMYCKSLRTCTSRPICRRHDVLAYPAWRGLSSFCIFSSWCRCGLICNTRGNIRVLQTQIRF